MSSFGQTLKRFRERTPGYTRPGRFTSGKDCLSQNELSRRAYLDVSYICLLERGKRIPSYVVVMALADGLGLSDLDRAALLIAAGYMPIRMTG